MYTTKSKYTNFLVGSTQFLSTISFTAILIVCCISLYRDIAGLFDGNTFAAGWILPVIYTLMSIAVTIIFLVAAGSIAGYYFLEMDDEESDDEEPDDEKPETTEPKVKKGNFVIGRQIFSGLIMLFAACVFFHEANLQWLDIVFIILGVLWLIVALLGCLRLLYIALEMDGSEQGDSNEPLDILESATVQKLIALKIADMQKEAEKNIADEFEKIKGKYITQPLDDGLVIDPAIKVLIENDDDYDSAMDDIKKHLGGILRKSDEDDID